MKYLYRNKTLQDRAIIYGSQAYHCFQGAVLLWKEYTKDDNPERPDRDCYSTSSIYLWATAAELSFKSILTLQLGIDPEHAQDEEPKKGLRPAVRTHCYDDLFGILMDMEFKDRRGDVRKIEPADEDVKEWNKGLLRWAISAQLGREISCSKIKEKLKNVRELFMLIRYEPEKIDLKGDELKILIILTLLSLSRALHSIVWFELEEIINRGRTSESDIKELKTFIVALEKCINPKMVNGKPLIKNDAFKDALTEWFLYKHIVDLTWLRDDPKTKLENGYLVWNVNCNNPLCPELKEVIHEHCQALTKEGFCIPDRAK